MAISGGGLRFVSSSSDQTFGSLMGSHRWVSDKSKLDQTRIDSFNLEYMGNTEPRRLLHGIAKGVSKYITTQTDSLSPIVSDLDQIYIYESKPPRPVVAEISVGEKLHETEENIRVISVEVKNIGTEKTTDRVRNLVLEALTSVRGMSKEELEKFVDSGEMTRLFRG